MSRIAPIGRSSPIVLSPGSTSQPAMSEIDSLSGSDFSTPSTRSAVELTEFQEDAVKKARRILARYDGVLVGDSVGLGKTWIGKKLLEDYAYHQRQKAVV